LVTESAGRNLAAVVHGLHLLVSEYAGHGGGENVDFSATLECRPFKGKAAGGLASHVELDFHWPAVWQKSVEGLLAGRRLDQRKALIGELVKDYLLIEFAGCEGGDEFGGYVVRKGGA
jgi:hypothetical protein